MLPASETASTTTAGAIVLHRGLLVATLNDDHLPPELDDGSWLRVGGVGGGCEAGESAAECAEREAREELCVAVELVSSPVTYVFGDAEAELHDWPGVPAPFARQQHGEYTCTLFAGRISDDPRPGDDVVALVFLPLVALRTLERSPAIGDLEAAGYRLLEARPLSRDIRLWFDPDEALRDAVPLVKAHPELFIG
jgi:ADP-ribose pyrophosphatase YjhB (NUDIX family)